MSSMERIRKGLKNMIIVKAVRTVFIAQGHIDFGGTPNDRTITKEFIYDSEKIPSSKDLLNFSNRNIVGTHSTKRRTSFPHCITYSCTCQVENSTIIIM